MKRRDRSLPWRNIVARSTRVVIEFNNFSKIAKRMPKAAMEIVDDTLDSLDETVKQGMAASSPPPSSPGAMPAIDTGELIGSLKKEREPGKYLGTYYTETEYADYLEYGTSKMLARPFMTPAAERERPKFMSRMQDLESKLDG